jgi:hypothetical protein
LDSVTLSLLAPKPKKVVNKQRYGRATEAAGRPGLNNPKRRKTPG